jgi:hypothetical protein
MRCRLGFHAGVIREFDAPFLWVECRRCGKLLDGTAEAALEYEQIRAKWDAIGWTDRP